jgi:hypothetical protein
VEHRRYTAGIAAKIDRSGFDCGHDEEAVFSSNEDQIRTSHTSGVVAGHPIVSKERSPGPVRIRVQRLAESLFTVLFPSDCRRICGEPLLNISRLRVCLDCLVSVPPIRGKVCSICRDRVLPSCAERDEDGRRRCPVCRRIARPFAHAVAYGSYEGGLSELVHRLPFNGVVARTLKLASNYAEFRLAGYGHPAGENEQREDVLVTTAMS